MTSASCLRVRPRNGPPEDVRITRRTSLAAPRLHRLENRRVLAVDRQDPRAPRPGQVHDQRAGDDQRFLVGKRHDLAGLECRPRSAQARPRRRSRESTRSVSGSCTIRIMPSIPPSTLRLPLPRKARSSSPAGAWIGHGDIIAGAARRPARPAPASGNARSIPRP